VGRRKKIKTFKKKINKNTALLHTNRVRYIQMFLLFGKT